jgi:hypothetical protein
VEPLLRITTVPIKYELMITKARLEYSNSKTEMVSSRQKGGFEMESRPIKVRIDTFDARNSVCPTTMESVRRSAQEGKSAAQEATATYAEEGAMLLDPNISNPLDIINQQRAQVPTGDFGLTFLPTTGPEIEWSNPDLTMQYQMDKLNFDFRVANGDFEFIPGDVSISITQMPDVQIEYTGGPMYVPPSAAEFFNHSPVDVLA